MPSKFVVRDFVKGGYYHIYNKGNGDQPIFNDEEDFALFYYYLSLYVTPLEKIMRTHPDLPTRLYQRNLSKEITLLAYSIVQDHYHFLLRQQSTDGISKLMKQLTNAYTQYYQKKYKRTGNIFQGRYKAIRIEEKNALSQIARHIHLHTPTGELDDESTYRWSSYGEYTKPTYKKLCSTSLLLEEYPSIYAFKKFTTDKKGVLKAKEKYFTLLFDDTLF